MFFLMDRFKDSVNWYAPLPINGYNVFHHKVKSILGMGACVPWWLRAVVAEYKLQVGSQSGQRIKITSSQRGK